MTGCFTRATKGWNAARHDASGALLDAAGRVYELPEDALYVFKLCDGLHDFASPAFLPRHRAALDHLMRMGAAWRCPRGFTGDAPVIDGALWAVTGRCNMKCRHCYMGAPEGQSELPLDAMARIVRALCEAGATSVELTGGEPFMRSDLFELIELLSENGIAVTDIFTNATLIDTKRIAALKSTGIRPRFHVSFDGVGAHDAMRGVPGAEARTLNGMRALIEAGYPVISTTSVDENALPALPATYDALRALGVHAWGLGRPMAAGCAKNMTRLDDARFAQACEEILARWQRDGKPFTLGLEAFYSEAATADMRREIPPFDPGLYACESCRAYPHITHEGDLLPCPCYADSEYGGRFGNLARISWAEAWANGALRRAMDIKKADVLAANPECVECRYLSECRTGCRVSALLAGNGLLGRDEIVCGLFLSGLKARFSSIGGSQA
jgi:radical SAM protein with 4Fe4S-binding SPASM domain